MHAIVIDHGFADVGTDTLQAGLQRRHRSVLSGLGAQPLHLGQARVEFDPAHPAGRHLG